MQKDWSHSLSLKVLLPLLLIISEILSASALSQTYKFETLWPQLSQPWYFQNPCGVAVDGPFLPRRSQRTQSLQFLHPLSV
jgi:hypothetical protein